MAELAILGGTPTFDDSVSAWPRGAPGDEEGLQAAVASEKWWSGLGEQGTRFAADFAAYHDCRHGFVLTNGTHTLQAALAALRLSPGAEVILPSYTFIATATAVLHSYAVPVFVDIDPETFCLDPQAVEQAIGPRTEAILAVHIAGHPADMDSLTRIADNRLAVIEDAAQAPGAEWCGRKVGSLGDIGSFSFQGTKTLTAGEGGAVTTDDQGLADRIYSTINAGRSRSGSFYDHFTLGSNYRMTELQASLLQSQFAAFAEQHRQRQANGGRLADLLRSVEGVTPQKRDSRATAHGYYTFTVLYDEESFGGLPRRDFMAALAAEGVPLMGVYPPLHLTQLFANLREECPAIYRLSDKVPEYADLDLPNTDFVASRAVCIKHQFLLSGDAAMERLVDVIERIREAAPTLIANTQVA